MATLRLRFRINLEGSEFSPFSHHGPLFHRWLPNGENDAIVLQTEDANAELKFWFERHGFVERDFIRFDKERHEVDPTVMVKQAILDAGPLVGLLSIWDLPEEELAPLRNNRKGDPRYETLGKKILKIIQPPLSRFIDTLRINFGQYWIRELEEWNSREHSLGSYCGLRLNLKWSLDEGKTWIPFMPNDPVGEMRPVIIRMNKRFDDYITQEDWRHLAEVVKEKYEPSPAALILHRTHEHLDQGNLKYAFIEGVTALEVALHEFVRDKLGGINALLTSVQSFWGLPLVAQVTIVVGTLEKVTQGDMENTVKAITTRNKIVHDGYNPASIVKSELLGLMKTVAVLLSGPEFRFPAINPGNAIKPVENWESKK